MMKKRLAVVALLMPFIVSSVPAQAADPAPTDDVAAGAATFTGAGHMPMFPCEPPEAGEDLCEGTWTGSFTGALSGRHTTADGDSVPWAVEIDAPGTAGLQYAEPDNPSTCAAGAVKGHATFQGGLHQAWGAYGNGVPIPAAIVGTRVSLAFEWHRQATAGPLVVTGLSIELEVWGLGWITVIDDSRSVSVADAAATFVTDEPLDCVMRVPPTLDGAMKGTLSGLAVSTS